MPIYEATPGGAAQPPVAPLWGLVLKWDDLFLYTGSAGEVCASVGHGLYRHDTRHLSGWRLTVNGEPLVTHAVTAGGNPPIVIRQTAVVEGQPSPVSIERERRVTAALQERTALYNPTAATKDVGMELEAVADFADIFTVRGMAPPPRGVLQPPCCSRDPTGATCVTFAYVGLDQVQRRTTVRVRCATPNVVLWRPVLSGSTVVSCRLPLTATLRPGADAAVEIEVSATSELHAGPQEAAAASPVHATGVGSTARGTEGDRWTLPNGARAPWHDPLAQGQRDLLQLELNLGYGPVFAAGVPWFVNCLAATRSSPRCKCCRGGPLWRRQRCGRWPPTKAMP